MSRTTTRTVPEAVSATRRNVLRVAVTGAGGACAYALGWRTAGAATAEITPAQLGEGLWLLQGAGGNVVAAAGPDGALMVDGGLAEHTGSLLPWVAAVTGTKRVQYLFNTHWRWEHTGSNETLAKAGASLIAHENTKEWLTARIYSKWENRVYQPRKAEALPTKTFYYGVQKLPFAGQDLEYAVMPQSCTDGDIYVYFPKQNVLVGGGVVSGGSYPVADYCTGGWLGGMIDGLKMLIARCDENTKVIPAAGPVRTRKDLQAQMDMCTAVISQIGTNYFKGGTWAQFQASNPTQAFDAQWGNPEPFLQVAYDGAWYHVNEIRRYGPR